MSVDEVIDESVAQRSRKRAAVVTRSLVLAVFSIGVLALSLVPAAAGAPSPKDACKEGGYLTLARSDGTSFKNQGHCVSYAVHGGTLFRGVDASSVYTALRGFGGPVGPPDANGDRIGSTGDGGIITGAFSFAGVCVPQYPNTDCFNFGMQFLGYVLHPTGLAEGNGTATCDPCAVAGHTGTLTFATTLVGHAVTINGMTFVALDGGTWRITSGTGDLAAISGVGTWTPGAGNTRSFSGKVLLPI
jgi:hypothetical protein